ncbi:GntR family transcriptional regulator [Diaminobutyricimonas aerilata]|uniref:GntR family transcriptional regulator n=2 Tax=Diaminobutyricimonas aerilata TaxID=1162967 RepID=A0A2M9CP67_9MICO|nr:GntR family transcriptional regulator [Diaminobutyricimonas aerilata]
MYMSTRDDGVIGPARSALRSFGKRSSIVKELETAIRRGELKAGAQLDGENALARRFSVSRGTVRQALEDLKDQGLITTVGGIGSFVTFDGVALDQSLGWARALQQAGGDVDTRVVDIELVEWTHVPQVDAADADRTGAARAVRIRRLRSLAGEGPISFEVSVLPAVNGLERLPDTGLVDGSIWATLHSAGLRAVRGTQDARLGRLEPEAATLLGRAPGEPFLCTDRWSYGPDGRLVEYVAAQLHPDHFRLTVTFGDPA